MVISNITVSECCLINLLPYILFEKYIDISALEMARPGNQHCASCIGALSFPVAILALCKRRGWKTIIDWRSTELGVRSGKGSARESCSVTSAAKDDVLSRWAYSRQWLMNCWRRRTGVSRRSRPTECARKITNIPAYFDTTFTFLRMRNYLTKS